MYLVINGERKFIQGSITITDLFSLLGLDQSQVAVELNREIIPRSAYREVELADGDQLEIVHFIGGGTNYV